MSRLGSIPPTLINMKYQEFQPPRYYTGYKHLGAHLERTIFLAGSIEMGTAEDWQKRVTKKLEASDLVINYPLNIFNPRRDDWNPDLKQEKNDPTFYQQVTWELDHLDMSTVIAMYFASDTLSPISLLELGLYAQTGKLVVLCPNNFWRNGNVDILCSRYGIPIFTNEDAWLVEIINRLR